MQEELRLQENKRILTELENKLNCYLSTGTTLAPASYGPGASAEKVSRDLHGQPHHAREPQQPAGARNLCEYKENRSWTVQREPSQDKPRFYLQAAPVSYSQGVEPLKECRKPPIPSSICNKRTLDAPVSTLSYLSNVKIYHAMDNSRTDPSVDNTHSLKLSTAATRSTREPMLAPRAQQHQSSVLFSLKTPTLVSHDAAHSFTSLNTKLHPMATTLPANTLQPAYTRSVLRPAVSSHNHNSLNPNGHSHNYNISSHSYNNQKLETIAGVCKDDGNSGTPTQKPSPVDDYNRRKSELDALVQRFEARKKSEVVGLPERSVSYSRNLDTSVGRGATCVVVPVPRINLQESLTEVSLGRSRYERQPSTVTEVRRTDGERSVDDKYAGEYSKSSCRTIALHSETGKTIRGSAEKIPITRERSRTIERYLRRKSSAYQLDEQSVQLEPKQEPANRKLSVDIDTTLRCRCLNTDSRIYTQNTTSVSKASNESDPRIEQSKVDKYPPRRLRSEAQDREYREIFNIKAYEEKENQPAYKRNLSRHIIEHKEVDKPSQQRLNRTLSTFTNQTFAGLEGSENSTSTRYATDDRLGLAQQKSNSSSQLLRDEQFLESLANLLVDKIGLKVQQQTATRKPSVEAYKPTRDLPARRELLSTSKFR